MKRQIVLAASLVAALLAAVLTRVYVSVKEAEVEESKARLLKRYGSMYVLCFKRDMPAGSVVTRDDFNERLVPELGMRGQAVTRDNLVDILGRKTVTSHARNDVVFWSDIEGGNPRDKGLSAEIKRSMRAVSINATGAASVSGMIKPNDHIDIIGTFDLPNNDGTRKKGEMVTCTLLQNVLVLATGRDTAKSRTARQGGIGGYSTVTVEVMPREAEILAFAEQIRGRLVLSLRNRNDTSTEKKLPTVDFNTIRKEIESLNNIRQLEKLGSR
jgi:pilus assembly protein CpaB